MSSSFPSPEGASLSQKSGVRAIEPVARPGPLLPDTRQRLSFGAMTQVADLLAEYAADHRNPVNRQLHTVCVPTIVVSLIGLLWSIPVPGAGAALPAFVNWATVAVALALAWYVRLSPRLAIGMVAGAALALGIVVLLGRLQAPLWLTSAAIFVVAWIGQFVGHGFEGKRPSFFRDLRFLLVGPLWVLAGMYQRLGIRV